MRIGILTISDKCSAGLREDGSGQAVADTMRAAGYEVAWYGVVPDEQPAIERRLLQLCDEQRIEVVLTTGGTGLAPRDVTPEATLHIADRQVPGISEAIRVRTAAQAPRSMLSRGVAVTRGASLVINLPGSPKAVRECIEILLPVLAHASSVLQGTAGECAALG